LPAARIAGFHVSRRLASTLWWMLSATFVLFCGLRAFAKTDFPPVSFSSSYYSERGLLPEPSRAVSVPGAADVSHTVRLTGPATLSVDLSDMTWVENRRTVFRNAGTADVRSPWVVVNGVRDWYDSQSIASEALDGATPGSKEAAMALWRFM